MVGPGLTMRLSNGRRRRGARTSEKRGGEEDGDAATHGWRRAPARRRKQRAVTRDVAARARLRLSLKEMAIGAPRLAMHTLRLSSRRVAPLISRARSDRRRMLATSSVAKSPPIAQRAMAFLDASPDQFHATATTCDRLAEAGFMRLDERDAWSNLLQPGGKYFFTRNHSCVVAFAVGGSYQQGNGFKVIGAHTDSPNLRIKPRPKRHAAGCVTLEVEPYGGGLWHTWFDRDLSISGRVMLRSSSGQVEARLVRVDRPVLRVPTLCIHLQTADEREAFKVHKEDHLRPILACIADDTLGASATGAAEAQPETSAELSLAAAAASELSAAAGAESYGWSGGQEPLLLQLIAEELQVPVERIADFECSLYDTQPASLSGARSEFLCSARIDNLASCFAATEALVNHASAPELLARDADVSLIALFDHEEVGSGSAVGAGSPIMSEAVRRISVALSRESTAMDEDALAAALRRSFVLSADGAHAVHPNYANKHQSNHGPLMNRGVVIKSNQNQRYASSGVTSFLVRELARRAGLPPPQEFAVRNDCPCGSTIGPIISANTGMRAVDVGMPQLSMHSIREVMGVADLTHGLDLFTAFFTHFRDVDQMLKEDGTSA